MRQVKSFRPYNMSISHLNIIMLRYYYPDLPTADDLDFLVKDDCLQLCCDKPDPGCSSHTPTLDQIAADALQ